MVVQDSVTSSSLLSSIPPSQSAIMVSSSNTSSSATLPGDANRDDDDVAREFAPIRSITSRVHRSMSAASQQLSREASHKETRDPELDIELPYRTLSATANLDEYRVEVPAGSIPGPVEPEAVARKSGQLTGERRYKLVTFTPNDPENPKNWSKAYKWWCTMVVALTCFVVALASSVITADIGGVVEDLHVSEEVALLSISVFVVGFGVGPMIFAPLSEIYGRRII